MSWHVEPPIGHGALIWVRILQDSDASPEQKDESMRRLMPLILSKAQIAASHLPRYLREDAIASAPAVIWEKIHSFNVTLGCSFSAWVQTVLTNWCIDEGRRAGRQATARGDDGGGDEMASVADGESSDGDQLERLLARRDRLRTALDRISWQPNEATRVHYFAVLLMRLRQGAVAEMGPALKKFSSDERELLPVPLSEFVRWCIDWRDSEEAATFKPAFPALGTIWNELRPIVDVGVTRIDGPQLCACIGRLTGERNMLPPNRWNTWGKRSKELARQRVDSAATWDELFGPLLGDREGRATGPTATLEER